MLPCRPLVLVFLLLNACMPPSVRAVDDLLEGIESGDIEQAAAAVHPDDEALLRQGLALRPQQPLAHEALAIPQTPLEHELLEISSKMPGAHVVLAELTYKNPLPFASERVGQKLDGMPETRKQKVRFRSEETPAGWRVRLDLPAVVERSRFVERFQGLLAERRLDDARQLLSAVPPPPDNAQSQKDKDRLVETLQAELAKAVDAAAEEDAKETAPASL